MHSSKQTLAIVKQNKNLEIDTTLSIKACIFTSSEIGKMEQHAKLFKNPRLFIYDVKISAEG